MTLRMPPLRRLALAALLLACAAAAAAPRAARAQPDSTRVALLDARGLPTDHTPRRALWRALAAPGWGQVYNRQYVKLPFVYGGLAGLGYLLYSANQNYILYRHAALFALGQEQAGAGEPNAFAQFEADYDEAIAALGAAPGTSVASSLLRTERDRFRRRRDLTIIGTGVFYALTVLDAYVAAHLLAFDVGEALSLRVMPTFGGPRATLRLRF